MSLVPADFVAPPPVHTDRFRLALLGPKHHESDYEAWTSSIDFIRSLPGWETSSWPRPMTPTENLGDCTSHLTPRDRDPMAGHQLAVVSAGVRRPLTLADEHVAHVFLDALDHTKESTHDDH